MRLRDFTVCLFTVFVCFKTVELRASKPTPPVEIEIATPLRVEGNSVAADIHVVFDADVARARLTIRGDGTTEIYPFTRDLVGPWKRGQEYSMSWTVKASRAGEGSLSVMLEALTEESQVQFSRTKQLFVLAEPQVLWTSSSSPTDLAFRRIEQLTARGVISAEEQTAMRQSVITAHAPTDNRPRAEEVWTPLQRNLQKAYGARFEAARSAAKIAPASAVTITVQGRIEWTDRNGVHHGLPMATVEIRDDDVIGSELIQTLLTDAAGNYKTTFTHDDGLLQGNPDIFVRVLARSPVADIKPDTLGASTYQLDSLPVNNEVPAGSTLTINVTAGNSADNETVYSLHHALVVIGAYAGGLTGTTPSRIDTRFPTTKETSQFTGTQLHILRGDRWDWDVIHHEYGHYVMAIHGFQQNPGGKHDLSDNLAVTRGSKDLGIRLAWGEGWPTFFGISGQRVTGAGSLGVPNVGDKRYQDTEDTSIDFDVESSTGFGEDNELSVITSLWDLYDSSSDGADAASFGDKKLFSALKSAAAKTMGAAWESLTGAETTRNRILIGAVLGQAHVAPELTDPVDNSVLKASGTPPTFKWKKNGGGTANPLNDFKIVFYKNDLSAASFEKDLGDTDHYTPSAADVAAILGVGVPVKWVVQGKNTSSPATPGGTLGRYWSAARTLGGVSIAFVIDDTGSMGEEISGVKSALQSYIDAVAAKLAPGEAAPTIQLITFKDDITDRLVSNDLAAVKSAVGSLTASGGGDCPEFSAHALLYASGNIAPGGTILLATDASPQPGVDLGSVIASLRAKGVTVNTILSGDCSSISSSSLDARQAETIFNNVAVHQTSDKPGADDPPQPPVTDPGQTPFDDHGDTPALATVLTADGTAERGIVGIDPVDIDFFKLPLTAGSTYVVGFALESGGFANFLLIDRNGSTVLQQRSVSDALPNQFVSTPAASGDYFLRVTTTSPAATPYFVSLREDPFAVLTSAIEVFSTVAAQTGGAFLVRDSVNTGNATPYQSAIFNVMASTLGPTVLASDPATLAQGTTLAVNLVGRNTNWRSSSTVHFSGSNIDVLSVATASATELTAMVRVSPAAALGFRDVVVETSLGDRIENAGGLNVIEVSGATLSPTLVSVEPATLHRGETMSVHVRGVNTAWGSGSVLTLGTDVTVVSQQVLSQTEIVAQVNIGFGAIIGFRTAQVSTPPSARQTKARSFFVDSAITALPVISSLTVDEAAPNQTVTLTLHGTNTHFQPGLTIASFGPGVTVQQVVVTDGVTASVTIQVAADATPGFRDISMTTGSETAVLLKGFFVAAAAAAIPAFSPGILILLALLLLSAGVIMMRKCN
jgi:hypothetical protein